jgi:hypothetical protein
VRGSVPAAKGALVKHGRKFVLAAVTVWAATIHAAPPDSAGELNEIGEPVVAEDFDHTDGVRVRVVAASDETLRVELTCGGCVLDATVYEWIAAVGPRARRLRQVDAIAGISTDATDSVIVSVAPAGLAPFGLEIELLLETAAGRIITKRQTVFGRLESGGVAAISWGDFVCDRGLAVCEAGANGRRRILLGADGGGP